MSERGGAAAGLLERAVDAVLAESSVELPEAVALARCTALMAARERLGAATSAALADVDRRELFALDCAGSTRGWLRTQLGGDQGQLGQARRLLQQEQVYDALALGELSGRGAAQLCTALEAVPDEVDPATLEAVLVDGLQDLLGRQLGRGLPPHVEPSTEQQALRAELASTVGDALADDLSAPARRLTPALLLLAREVAPGQLGWALTRLLDALVPDSIDPPDSRSFYLDLVPVLDGDWDLRGHLDHETGTLLAAELARQRRVREHAQAAAVREAAERNGLDFRGSPGLFEDDYDAAWAVERRAQAAAQLPALQGGTPGPPLMTRGQQRHDDLTQLLRDAADRDAGVGKPAPTAITVIATEGAVEGRAGALPGMLCTVGRPVNLSPQALQRLGCFSELTAVLVDAAGRPVGASSTRRTADRRERAALAALWGPFCAVLGCLRTDTEPHHVEPWWLSRQTLLVDLVPLCTGDHHHLHDRERTLLLKDGRRINARGWVLGAV